jgi:hypothetical protein
LDADDRWTSVKLARQLSLLKTRPELAATSSYGFYVGSKDRTFGLLEMGPTSIEDLRRLRDRQKPVWLLTSSVVCRRDVLIGHGGFDPSFGGAAEDLDLWTRIGERHDILTMPEHLVGFRISAVSASMVKHLQVQQNTVRVRLNIRRRALGLPLADAHEFRTWLAAHDAEVREWWMPAWRSAYYYRQAGHHFLQREYVSGLVDLARSSFASPRHVARKLRRQVVPFMLRGIGA